MDKSRSIPSADGAEVTLVGQFVSDGWSGAANYIFNIEDGLISAWYLL